MFNLKSSAVKKQAILAASFSLVTAIYSAPGFAVVAADPVILTFSTVGDSRQDPQNIDPSSVKAAQVGVGNCQIPSGATGLTVNPGLSGQDCKWLQNTTAWARIMRTIQSQKSQLLFFNGDMIMGYGKAGVPVTRNGTGVSEAAIASPVIDDVLNADIMQIYKQYGFWRGMVATLMETGTYVVPVPGNHEVQCKRCGKAAQVENENAWRDNMGDLILDTARFTNLVGTAASGFSASNTPAIGGLDGVTTDQSKLSYSFDVGASHFAIINTDAVGKDGFAPTAWLDADMLAAEGRGAKRMFVFGHKPAVFYNVGSVVASTTSSLSDKNLAAGTAFWTVIDNHKATYFSGHEHTYKVSKLNGLTNSYQVIVGAGGSPFESPTATGIDNDRMYSWATVKVFQSGAVQMDTWGFDPTMTNPIRKLETVTLPHLL